MGRTSRKQPVPVSTAHQNKDKDKDKDKEMPPGGPSHAIVAPGNGGGGGGRGGGKSNEINVNDLLNFHLPPRVRPPPTHIPVRRGGRRPAQPLQWSKDKYINAQYRFLMAPTGDYTVHFADPDIHFQWNDILQVVVPRESAIMALPPPCSPSTSSAHADHPTCAICLSEHVAPRMTKCGHIYCYPCILHYLQIGENPKFAKCPVCGDSIYERQLKPVSWLSPPSRPSTSPASAGKLEMTLIRRPQTTTLALPPSPTWPSDALLPHQAPFHFAPDVTTFARFMLASPAHVRGALARDLGALEDEKRAQAGDDLGVLFVEAAERKVREALQRVDEEVATPGVLAAEGRARRDLDEIAEREGRRRGEAERREGRRKEAELEEKGNEEDKVEGQVKGNGAPAQDEAPEEFLALRPVGFAGGGLSPPAQPFTPSTSAPSPSLPTPASATSAPAPPAPPTVPRSSKPRRNVNPPPPDAKDFYFYQSASGHLIFLHPLDIRLLLHHFKSYASFPARLALRVERADEGTMDEDLRKRCKYLAHVPSGADVVFVEADLEEVVGEETRRAFEGPLKQRRAKRKEKTKKEDRALARHEARERELERERYASEGFTSTFTPSASASASARRASFSAPPPDDDELAAALALSAAEYAARPAAPSWGSGPTFASAAGGGSSSGGRGRRDEEAALDEEYERAWDALEDSMVGEGGGRMGGTSGKAPKKSKKRLVLGGGGGRRGR